jgi:hypothetical protein
MGWVGGWVGVGGGGWGWAAPRYTSPKSSITSALQSNSARARSQNVRVRGGSADHSCISGLVVEYIVAIDVTRVRFPADAFVQD